MEVKREPSQNKALDLPAPVLRFLSSLSLGFIDKLVALARTRVRQSCAPAGAARILLTPVAHAASRPITALSLSSKFGIRAEEEEERTVKRGCLPRASPGYLSGHSHQTLAPRSSLLCSD